MKYEREIERKFVVLGLQSFESLESLLTGLLGLEPERAESNDRFWIAPGVDFVRLRENSSELTVKVTDRGTVTDRIEENVVVKDTEAAARLCTLLFGEKVGQLTKRFTVWWCPTAVVALYSVHGDDRIFLEVESKEMAAVDEMVTQLARFMQLSPETRSLFQIMFPSASRPQVSDIVSPEAPAFSAKERA